MYKYTNNLIEISMKFKGIIWKPRVDFMFCMRFEMDLMGLHGAK